MEISDKPIVQLIVDQCKNYGIRHVVFSPGSRNAPFAISFDGDASFNTHVIHDERVAAFYAIGLAQTCNEAVALCCTSGSAVVNYYPAITEAFYRKIPILVISADRPKALLNKGHGQTIMQNKIFGSHVLSNESLEDFNKNEHSQEEYIKRLDDCFSHLISLLKGPVHINVHLNEPLYETVQDCSSYRKDIHQTGAKQDDFELSPSLFEHLEAKKILVLCGQYEVDNVLNEELIIFNQNTNVVVLNENISGLQDGAFINCIDRSLNSISENLEKDYVPEVLITIGDAVVSKKIKAFFIKNKPELHIAINYSDIGIDSFHCIGMHLKTSTLSFFRALNNSSLNTNTHNYKSYWEQLDEAAKKRLPSFFNIEKTSTDIRVFHAINERLEKNTTLHMSNSSVVRYMQLFDPIKSIKYECNRGTSGIDGSLSTAIGSAIASPKENHLFISGDISFIYDSNALWITPFPKNLKMIVIDNQGGGIFRIIDGASTSSQLERYFEAKHDASVIEIAKGFGVSGEEVVNFINFENTLDSFFNKSSIQLLVIRTDANENPKALNRMFKHLRNA